MVRRIPDNRPVSIKISAKLANALLEHGPDLIDALKHQAVLRDQVSEERKVNWEAEQAQRQKEHRRIAIQAYRRWRRLNLKEFKSLHQAQVALAQEFDLDRVYLVHLVSHRRFEVKRYVQKRRNTLVARLYLEGRSNAEIIDRVGISDGTISRIIRDNKPLLDSIRMRLREQEAQS